MTFKVYAHLVHTPYIYVNTCTTVYACQPSQPEMLKEYRDFHEVSVILVRHWCFPFCLQISYVI